MFRRRDEEENAIDAANQTAEKSTTSFGNFMGNDAKAEKKAEPAQAAGSGKSLFGVNTEKKEVVTTPLENYEANKPAEKDAAPKTVSSIFSKPVSSPSGASSGASSGTFSGASSGAAQSKPSTYKLSAGGAITSTSGSGASSNSSPIGARISASATSATSTNSNTGTTMDKIETEKRLTVGYGITLEGKISNCDKLIVYGYVNADLTDVKTLHISESGKFSGFAAIENAEISGAFEGDLIVENSIVINATGKMSGKVTYGSIEIKPGGKFTGQIVDASDLAASGGETKAKRSVKKADDSAEAKSQDEFTLSPEPIKEIA